MRQLKYDPHGPLIVDFNVDVAEDKTESQGRGPYSHIAQPAPIELARSYLLKADGHIKCLAESCFKSPSSDL